MNGTFSDEVSLSRGEYLALRMRVILSIDACSPSRFGGATESVMKTVPLVLALFLVACSREVSSGNDAELYQSNSAVLTPGVQPVRVGEGGAAYPACTGTGTVVNLSPSGESYLSLRAAPFAEANEVTRLNDGAPLFLCSRSLDQRWQGVVVPPIDTPNADCGVTTPLAGAQAYAGPCKSGWVLTAFVRPSAG